MAPALAPLILVQLEAVLLQQAVERAPGERAKGSSALQREREPPRVPRTVQILVMGGFEVEWSV